MRQISLLSLEKIKKCLQEGLGCYSFFNWLAEDEGFQEKILEYLSIYVESIMTYNQEVNITGARTMEEIINKHVLDSLIPFFCHSDLFGVENEEMKTDSYRSRVIADVGTGAGFPGIPLALILSRHCFLLIESKKKKSHFLELMQEKLQLENVEVITGNVMEVRRKVDVIVLRAFADMRHTLKLTRHLLKRDSYYLFYKGRKKSMEDEMAQLSREKVECYKLRIPFYNMERHLVKLTY